LGSGIRVRLEGIGFASALPHTADVVVGVTLRARQAAR